MINRIKTFLLLSLMICFSGILETAWAQNSHDIEKTNLLSDLDSENLNGFDWLNPPNNFDISGGILTVVTDTGTDFFIDPENHQATATAPFLFKKVKGDFIATALLKPDFSDQWNACALFMVIDQDHWIKFAFENSDATGKTIVSVVTRGVSDDANGAILKKADQVWLKLIRKGDLFALHWSLDGKAYQMSRLAAMPKKEMVQIGLEAQCPVGKSARHQFLHFNIQNKSVVDLRKGI